MRERDDRVGGAAKLLHLRPGGRDGVAVAHPVLLRRVDRHADEADPDGPSVRRHRNDRRRRHTRERRSARVGDVGGDDSEPRLRDVRAERSLRHVELVVAERRPVDPGGIQDVDHLSPCHRLPVHDGRPERRRRQVVAPQRRQERRLGRLQLLDHRGHPRQPARLPAFDRQDFVDVVEVHHRHRDRCRRGLLLPSAARRPPAARRARRSRRPVRTPSLVASSPRRSRHRLTCCPPHYAFGAPRVNGMRRKQCRGCITRLGRDARNRIRIKRIAAGASATPPLPRRAECACAGRRAPARGRGWRSTRA